MNAVFLLFGPDWSAVRVSFDLYSRALEHNGSVGISESSWLDPLRPLANTTTLPSRPGYEDRGTGCGIRLPDLREEGRGANDAIPEHSRQPGGGYAELDIGAQLRSPGLRRLVFRERGAASIQHDRACIGRLRPLGSRLLLLFSIGCTELGCRTARAHLGKLRWSCEPGLMDRLDRRSRHDPRSTPQARLRSTTQDPAHPATDLLLSDLKTHVSMPDPALRTAGRPALAFASYAANPTAWSCVGRASAGEEEENDHA
jgi:hypothetical protein